jgi:hypothetical protein
MKPMKTILSLTTGIQKFLIVITFGLLSLAAHSTGNLDSIQAVTSPAAKVQSVNQVPFTALANNNKAELKWTAAPGINISHFVIEKSTDGVNYHDAAVIFAFEDATDKIDYRYADKLNSDQAGVVYYRICVIAENGKADYSDIRIIRTAGQTENTKN